MKHRISPLQLSPNQNKSVRVGNKEPLITYPAGIFATTKRVNNSVSPGQLATDRRQSFEVPDKTNTVSDIYPSINLKDATEHIKKILNDEFQFSKNLKPEVLSAQKKLQNEYITYAAAGIAARNQEYKSGSYDYHQNMQTQVYKALPAIGVAGLQGGISSSSRTPARSALMPHLDPNNPEFSTIVSRDAASGAFAGFTGYVANEIVNKAITRVATSSNLAEIKPVSIKALMPEPSRIVLKIDDDNIKSFVELDVKGPEHIQRIAEHKSRINRLADWQRFISGEGPEASSLQPILTGVANTIRRGVSTVKGIVDPDVLFFTGAMASGTAGAATKVIFATAQVSPWMSQIEVDNYVGGKQKVNLFDVRPNNLEIPAAGITDIRAGIYRTGAEALALTGHALSPIRPLSDIAYQAKTMAGYVISNVVNSVAGSFLSLAGREVMDGSLEADSYERHDSKNKLAQQFTQSALGEWLYKLMPSNPKSHGNSLDKSLDNKRDFKEANYRSGAATTLNSVRAKRLNLMPKNSGSPIPGKWLLTIRNIDNTLKDKVPDLKKVTKTLKILNEAEHIEGYIRGKKITDLRSDMQTNFKKMETDLINLQKLQISRNPNASPENRHAE
jgi:hypothetical protein